MSGEKLLQKSDRYLSSLRNLLHATSMNLMNAVLYSEVSNKRTVYAYLFSEKIPPCTLLLETCTLINFLL